MASSAPSGADSASIASDDAEYLVSMEQLERERDDETTLEEEERLGRDTSAADEITMLEQEGSIPIEELLQRYGYQGGRAEDEENEDEDDDDDDQDSEDDEDEDSDDDEVYEFDDDTAEKGESDEENREADASSSSLPADEDAIEGPSGRKRTRVGPSTDVSNQRRQKTV